MGQLFHFHAPSSFKKIEEPEAVPDQRTPDQLRNSPGPRKVRFLLYGIVLGVLLSPKVWAAQGATVDLPLTARLLSNGVPVSGKTINFQVGVGSGTANPPQS
jgi:hypothetical protein